MNIVKLKGFTLIELAIVIVILAVIAILAIPRLIDLAPEARQRVTDGVAAALNAASAGNFALSKTGSPKAKSVGDCTEVANLLPTSKTLPSGFTIIPQAISAGTSVTCTVVNPNGTTTSTFIGHGV